VVCPIPYVGELILVLFTESSSGGVSIGYDEFNDVYAKETAAAACQAYSVCGNVLESN
jgi:hypothetical protein